MQKKPEQAETSGTTQPQEVSLYFDFISPYAWLALGEVESFSLQHNLRLRFEPVVYGALLSANGLTGPVETERRRNYTFADIMRCAARLKRTLVGPPNHPFRSMDALRVACLFAESEGAGRLIRSLSDAAWERGLDLADWSVLENVVNSCGLDGTDLPRRAGTDAIKSDLRRRTEAALAAGVFGVPTFRLGNELFWGHDRMPHLADALERGSSVNSDMLGAVLKRPGTIKRL